ncbi:MAG: ABC transporter substrate-binding protein [Alphaproteobacteria bacterium]|nr:ABC transporter substrate-binding protein [Alphaproteobacteria bacterium]
MASTDPQMQARLAAFQQGIRQLGWDDGRNVQIDYRFALGRAEQAELAAQELAALKPDVIVAHSTPNVVAMRNVAPAVQVIFVMVSEPVSQGFVKSLASPGGNLTGFSNSEPTMGPKWLELLKEMAPRTTQACVMFNPDTAPYVVPLVERIKAVAERFAVQVISAEVREASRIEPAIAALAPTAGLIVPADIFIGAHRQRVLDSASLHRIPAIYGFNFIPSEGGLMSYGPDFIDQFRKAAEYTDRILRGAKAADLPVQQPTKFEMVINLKTAKALGLNVSLALQTAADQVIE